MNLTKAKNVIAAFVEKLLLKRNLPTGEYSHFPTLSAISAKHEDLRFTYYQHLDVLYVAFTEQFQDILHMNTPSWVLYLFKNADTAESSNLAEELLKFTTNDELKVKLRNEYQEF